MSFARSNTLAPPADAWQKAYAYDVDGNCIYEGWAAPSVLSSAASWAILSRTYTANSLTSEKWADGNTNVDNVWDDRSSLTYA